MPTTSADWVVLFYSLFWALPGIIARFWAVGVAAAVTMILVVTSPRV